MKNMAETIPNRVRINKVKEKVRDYLESKQINSPPINPKVIIQQIENIKIQETNEIDDAFVVYNKLKDEFGIVINTDHVEGRINWTYAHELGHIALDHAVYMNEIGLTEYQRKVIEREADVFARELLMPEEMLKEKLKHPITLQQIGKLRQCFNVSWSAIINRLDELGIKSRDEIYELLEKNKRKNSTEIEAIETDYIGESKHDQKLLERFTKCPDCGNDEFSSFAAYCKKCGCYLYNKCEDSKCGSHNVSDALFCEYCGNDTKLRASAE
jgi:Zn-dependent peptidase ImmA (M78 family)